MQTKEKLRELPTPLKILPSHAILKVSLFSYKEGVEALDWSNFSFLTKRWPLLAELGEAGERNLHPDPNTTLFKLRLFGEKMARIIYAEEKPIAVEPHNQNERLRVLRREADLPGEVIGMFHSLCQKGNDAVHEGAGTIQEAKSLLKIAYKLGVWFMQTYGDWDFRPEPYREPEPRLEPEEIRREIEEKYRREQEQRERELEQKLAAELERMRLTTLSHKEMLNRRAQARRAADRLDLTEEETRRIIDEQLALAGWDVDSRRIRYAKGARPEKGKNQAIAEWPTACGPADYALFIGLRLVGLVEAKKISKNIPSDLEQAKEYARHVEVQGEEEGITRWGDYRVPFVFATNGRDYFQQVEEQSGIWYQDLRSRRNRGRALPAWFSPEDLEEKLSQDEEQALERLAGGGVGLPQAPSLSGTGDSGGGAGHPGGEAGDAFGHGHRHREDPHRHRPDLPAHQEQNLPSHPLSRRSKRSRRAGGKRI